jgi:hypothetical protein
MCCMSFRLIARNRQVLTTKEGSHVTKKASHIDANSGHIN